MDLSNIIMSLITELQNRGIEFNYSIEHRSITTGQIEDSGNIKEGRNYNLTIITENEEIYISNNQINDEKFMELMYVIFHEYRHIVQIENSKYNPDFSKNSINIAKMSAIKDNGFEDYYFNNYDNDIAELDASIYGIEEAIRYVNSHFPQVDAERGVLSFIRKDIQEEYPHFRVEKANSVEECINELTTRMNNPSRVDLREIMNKDGINADIDIIDNILLKQEVINKYRNCKTAEEKDNFIILEMCKLRPEILLEYPILQNNIGIENKKQETFKEKYKVELDKIEYDRIVEKCENGIYTEKAQIDERDDTRL